MGHVDHGVVIWHNEEAFIEDCLSSLTTQTLLPKKIIVVDDNSKDKTPRTKSVDRDRTWNLNL